MPKYFSFNLKNLKTNQLYVARAHNTNKITYRQDNQTAGKVKKMSCQNSSEAVGEENKSIEFIRMKVEDYER